jgi:hypothetical protein
MGKTKGTTQDGFREILTCCFAGIEADFRAQTVARYRAAANSDLEAWRHRLGREPALPSADRTANRWSKSFVPYYQQNRPHGYVKFDRSRAPRQDWIRNCTDAAEQAEWEWHRECFRLGLYTADREQAEQDAHAVVDSAKAHFVEKQSQKLTSACGDRLVGVAGGLSFHRGVITGYLDVTAREPGEPAEDGFRLELSIIVNRRHEPRYIEFYQFPARFTQVRLAGEEHAQASEAWLAEHWSGNNQPAREPRYVSERSGRPGWYRVLDRETGQAATGTYPYRSQGAATRAANKLEAARG